MSEFVELVKSPGHWMFEIMLMIIFDGVIGIMIWPFIKHLWDDHKKFHKITQHYQNIRRKRSKWKMNQIKWMKSGEIPMEH